MKHLLILIFTTCLLHPLSAQLGGIRGQIYSRTRQPIPYAHVSLLNGSRHTQTDSTGRFVLDSLPTGFHRLYTEAEGYETLISTEQYVQARETTYVEIILNEAQVELGEVVVRSRSKIKMLSLPLTLITLGLKDLEKGAGVNRDVSKAIQTLAGVAATDANRNDLMVRGGGPAENKFYLDGIEIPVINHFSTQGASGGVVGMVNPDFVEEVNFYTSHLPARAKTLSSVMEIRQRDGNKERLHTKISVGASDAAITLDGPLGAKSSFIVSARQSYLQYLFKALRLPFLPTYNDFQLKYKHQIGERGQLSIIGIGAIDRMRLNTSLQISGTESQRYLLGYLPEYHQANYTIGAVYKHFADSYTDSWVLSRNWLYNASEKYLNNDKSLAQILDYQSHEVEHKLRFERSYTTLPIRLSVGGGIEHAEYDNKTKRQANPIPVAYSSTLSLWSYQLFAEASKSYWSDRLGISFALALQGSNLRPALLNPFPQLSPRLAITYNVSEQWRTRLSMARYSMLPPYTTLGFKTKDSNYINKQRAQYIHTNHLTLGTEYSPKEQYRLGAELFYKDYKHYPISVADGISLASKGLDYGQVGDEEVVPLGRGRAYGIELYGYLQPSSRLKLVTNYTYSRSLFTDMLGVYRPSSWDTHHIINILLSYQLAKGWMISARGRLVGPAPYTPIDMARSSDQAAWVARGRAYLDYTQFNTARLPATHQLDIRIDKEFYLGHTLLNLYVDVQNVYAHAKQQAPIYTNLDKQGQIMRDPVDPAHKQLLRSIPSSTATLLPTLGIILKL